MKKHLLVAILVVLGSSLDSKACVLAENSEAPAEVKLTLTTDANGEIASITPSDSKWDEAAWHIRDVSGATNIRNKPNGKIVMKLKAYTQYEIYGKYDPRSTWILITSCYNLKEKYWVRLHDSNTGQYWIASSVLY